MKKEIRMGAKSTAAVLFCLLLLCCLTWVLSAGTSQNRTEQVIPQQYRKAAEQIQKPEAEKEDVGRLYEEYNQSFEAFSMYAAYSDTKVAPIVLVALLRPWL